MSDAPDPLAWEKAARAMNDFGERAAAALCEWIDRVLYTDAEYVAIVWPSIERNWVRTLAAWTKGSP